MCRTLCRSCLSTRRHDRHVFSIALSAVKVKDVLGNFAAVSSMHGISPSDHLSTAINSSKSCCRCCNLLDPTKPWKTVGEIRSGFSDKTMWNSEGSTDQRINQPLSSQNTYSIYFRGLLAVRHQCCRTADVPNQHSYHLKSSKPIDKMWKKRNPVKDM